MITIRSPQWIPLKPYQDIPIMIFNHAQWNLVRKEKLVVSAAPFLPGELGRNSKYVFALEPRYIHGDLPGTQEVYELMRAKPFHAPCKR
jgi:bla regulator protein blaR1